MKFIPDPRIVLIGSVNSSRATLEKLIEHQMNIVGVFGLALESTKNVSGYVDLKTIAKQNDLNFSYFNRINDEDVIDQIEQLKPDLLFVIGLSQIVKETLLDIPRIGCIGFHPTKLPEGRGRAAIAWIILDKISAGPTFFIMTEKVDAGPIIAQETFKVSPDDYAQDVIDKVIIAIDKALDEMLPLLKDGSTRLIVQDESCATFLGKRAPEDGIIDWTTNTENIYRLIRATSRPLPGAFTYYMGQKITIFRALPEKQLSFSGVPGRVLRIEDNPYKLLVKTGDGALWITECKGVEIHSLKVGIKLG